MAAHAPHTFDTHHLVLLDRIARRLAGRGRTDDDVRDAVTLLTADADPVRADRLAVHPGESPVLVERLAAWALRHASDGAVEAANRILDGEAAVSVAPVTVSEEAVLAAC